MPVAVGLRRHALAGPSVSGRGVAAGMAVGVALDRVLGDPRRGHPVAGFGAVASALEAQWYRDSRSAGVVYEAVLVGGVLAATAAARWAVRWGLGPVAVTALATWTALGGTSLARVGSQLADNLECGDIAAARALLPALCGRDPQVLDAAGLARAGIESLAENTSDAAVAPLFWGAVAGPVGLLGYRAVNTLDAMVGYRSDRYRRFGWAAARFDDLANLIPARMTGALTAGMAPRVGGSAPAALRAWWRDAGKHPSPNAGVVEAAAAGALGVRLGGATHYRHGVQLRPELGQGRAPTIADLRKAVQLTRGVQLVAAVLCVTLAVARERLPRDL